MRILLALAAFLTLAGAGHSFQQDGAGGVVVKGKPAAKVQEAAMSKAHMAIVKAELPSYPLDVCPISNEALDANGGAVDVVHDGHLVRVCCDGCAKKVPTMGPKIRKQVEAAVIAKQKATYPMAKCVVANVPLEKGKAVDVVVGTRLVRTCCEKCAAKVTAGPAPFLAKIDGALIEKQRASYPLETCIVSGEPLDAMGGPVDKLYGVQLVRLCCDGCAKSFDRTPQKFLTKLAKATKAGQPLGAKNKLKGKVKNKGKAKGKGVGQQGGK